MEKEVSNYSKSGAHLIDRCPGIYQAPSRSFSSKRTEASFSMTIQKTYPKLK